MHFFRGSYMQAASFDGRCRPCSATLLNPQSKSSGKTVELQPSSTSSIHANKKRKDKLPLIESEVRRSERIQLLNKGYKRNLCLDRNCMPCNANPPIVASKIVRNLSASFCKIQEINGSNVTLQSKEKKAETSTGAH